MKNVKHPPGGPRPEAGAHAAGAGSPSTPSPPSLGAALARIGKRFGLEQRQCQQLESLLRALSEDAHAPSAVTEPLRAADVHVADSLSALEVTGVRDAQRLVDLGSGAGIPGVVLAIALPLAQVRLVEAERRRCEYIARSIDGAAVRNARAVWTRAEEWGEGLGWADLVTARALAPQPVVLEYAAPLMQRGAVLLDWRGRRDEIEERASAVAAEQVGLARREIRRVEPFEGARDHHLHVYEKVADTPGRFPRRAGVARKRPLGAGGSPAAGARRGR